MKPLLVAPLLALVLVSGCGGDDSEAGDPSQTPVLGADYPACDEVWVVGKTLPEDYDGCLNGDTLEAAAAFACNDGTKLSSYQDRFWVLTPGTIADAGESGTATDPDYGVAYDACNYGG